MEPGPLWCKYVKLGAATIMDAISPRQLQQRRQAPTFSELRAASALRRLSRGIAARFCDQDLTYRSDRPPGPRESAVAVFFGMFRAEETLLTTTPLEGSQTNMIMSPAVPETTRRRGMGDYPVAGVGRYFFDFIFNDSERPNHIVVFGVPVALLELKFFKYSFSGNLGLCLDAPAFRENRRDRVELPYQEFVDTITIFSHDDVESRCSFTYSDRHLDEASFLDGSEVLTKYSPSFQLRDSWG
jgi:hypothetical protein